MSTEFISNLDPIDFLSEDPAIKNDFIQRLGQSFSNIGFVCVKNNFIDISDVDAFYKSVEAFFALPTEVKRRYEIPELAGQRGYTSFGREHAKGSEAPDLKEFWQIGQEVQGSMAVPEDYPANVQVAEISNFNELSLRLYRGFEKSGAILLKAIACYLGLNENYFEDNIRNGNSILRAIHYPPITSEPKNAIRAEAHEDINLITLLVGASAEGLEVQKMDGSWLPINAPENHFVINVGDMLQRLTNNKLKSTTHRVVNPPREKWANPRFSIPFFLHPVSGMDLTCLPSCVSDSNPSQFEPITAGDYLDERLREIGLKK
jgi:isopenicillin N synthase-like dioxygenase